MTEERKRELAEMSDNWLAAMIEKKEQELEELVAEHDRRRKPTGNCMARHVKPSTLAELEREIHSFGDHYGFDATVGMRPDGMIVFTEAGE